MRERGRGVYICSGKRDNSRGDINGGHWHYKIISITVAQTVKHNVMGSIPGERMN